MQNITELEAMNLNRTERRALASKNKTGKIPARKNVKIHWTAYLKIWELFMKKKKQ